MYKHFASSELLEGLAASFMTYRVVTYMERVNHTSGGQAGGEGLTANMMDGDDRSCVPKPSYSDYALVYIFFKISIRGLVCDLGRAVYN